MNIRLITLGLLVTTAFTGCEQKPKQDKPSTEHSEKKTEDSKQEATTQQQDKSSDNAALEQKTTDTEKALEEKAEKKSESEIKSETAVSHDKAKKIAVQFVDGTTISYDEVMEKLQSLPAEVRDTSPLSKLFSALRDRMVDIRILTLEAKKAGLDKDAAAIKAMNEASENEVKKAFLEQEIQKIATTEYLKKRYDQIIKQIPADAKEIRLFSASFAKVEEAKNAVKALGAHPTQESFSKMAKEKSIDKQTSKQGGDLGYVREEDLPKPLLEMIKKGGIIGPLELGDKVVILYPADSRKVQPPSFEKVRSELKRGLNPILTATVLRNLEIASGVKKIGLDGKPIAILGFNAEGEPEQHKIDEELYKDIDADKLDASMVLATFTDGHTITLGQLREEIKALPPSIQSKPLGSFFNPLLDRKIIQHLMDQAIKASTISNQESVKKSMENAREMALVKVYQDKNISEKITDKLMQAKYAEVKKLLPQNDMEARLRHIVVGTEAEAEALIEQLKKHPTDFDKAVVTHSIDESTKPNNGEIGEVKRSSLPAEIGDLVFSAAPGTIVRKPVQLKPNAWSVMKVEDKKPVPVPTVKQLENELKQIIASELLVEKIKELHKKYKADKYDIDGNKEEDTEDKSTVGNKAAAGA